MIRENKYMAESTYDLWLRVKKPRAWSLVLPRDISFATMSVEEMVSWAYHLWLLNREKETLWSYLIQVLDLKKTNLFSMAWKPLETLNYSSFILLYVTPLVNDFLWHGYDLNKVEILLTQIRKVTMFLFSRFSNHNDVLKTVS